MARVKRHFPDNLLPQGHQSLGIDVDLSARFCYFLDLNEAINYSFYESSGQRSPATTGGLLIHKRNLFENARRNIIQEIQNDINIANHDSQIISSAIEFIGRVAENERRKEMNVIRQYTNELRNSLPSILRNNSSAQINRLLRELDQFANTPFDQIDLGSELNSFYEKLTLCINAIRNGAQETRNRLIQILSTNRETFAHLARDNEMFRLGTDLNTFIKSAIGLNVKRNEVSFEAELEKVIGQYIDTQISAGTVNEDNLLAILIGVFIDFRQFLQNRKDAQNIFSDLISNGTDQLTNIFYNEYLTSQTPSYFLQALNNNQLQIDELNKVLRTQLGLQQLTDNDQIRQRANALTRAANRRHRTSEAPNVISRIIKQNHPNIYRNVLRNLDFIEWVREDQNRNITGSLKGGRLGSLFELKEVFQKLGIKIEGHPATDVITFDLFKIRGNVDLNNLTDIIYNGLTPAIQQIEDFEKQNREDALHGIEQNFIEMNQAIEHEMHELDELLNLPDAQKFFIFHESLKLYTRIETRGTSFYSGRDLQILSALDRIYSLDNIGITLPDREVMFNLALNLSNNSIAHGTQITDLLEQYLSIFSGLLMFDDITNMALEAARDIEYKNIDNIHLYYLNGVYVLNSMILTYIYKALHDGLNHISSNRAARALITTRDAESEIEDYLATHQYGSKQYQLEDWKTERENIAKKTHLKIVFLSSFITFIRDLSRHMDMTASHLQSL